MTNSEFAPHNRHELLEILKNRDTPTTTSYPRRYLAQADLYLREYGPDSELLEARQLLENRLLYNSY